MKICNYCIVSVLFTLITSVLVSQIIPPSRNTDWSVAGLQGNIPIYSIEKNIMDFGAVADGITSNDLALQNAINSLHDENGVIHFPAGVFLFTAPIPLRSGLILKGEGSAVTTLKFNLSGTGHLIKAEGTVTNDSAYVISTVLKNTNVLQVANAAPFHNRGYIKIYEDDALLVNDIWALGTVGQLLQIDTIIGNNIHFSNALRRTYLLSKSPVIRRVEMLTGSGIECLKIKRMDATVSQTANLFFSNAANCWVKGVESDSCNFAHLQISGCTNIDVTNNYFHGAFAYGGGGQGYGVSCENTSGECLIENNVFKHLRHSMLLQSGANGNVFDYNYSLEPFKTDSLPFDLSGDIVLHGNYPYLNLLEGNIVQNIVVDASHGINGPFNTFFRNRAELYGLFITPGAGDSTNIVGNEITGRGFQQGNFIAYGSGNFLWANNKNDTIIPAGSNLLTDKSYRFNSSPVFWNIESLWPSIGLPNMLAGGTIPAKKRYNTGINPAYCLAEIPMIYTFNGNGNWSLASNWEDNLLPPPVLYSSSEIIIDPLPTGKCVLNIPYVINPGIHLTVRHGKKFDVQANLTLVK